MFSTNVSAKKSDAIRKINYVIDLLKRDPKPSGSVEATGHLQQAKDSLTRPVQEPTPAPAPAPTQTQAATRTIHPLSRGQYYTNGTSVQAYNGRTGTYHDYDPDFNTSLSEEDRLFYLAYARHGGKKTRKQRKGSKKSHKGKSRKGKSRKH